MIKYKIYYILHFIQIIGYVISNWINLHCNFPLHLTISGHVSSWTWRNMLSLKYCSEYGDESAYRQEVKELAVWCSLNNLELNTLKTVEMIVNFRRNPPALPPLTIMNNTVAVFEMPYYHTTLTISAACSMYAAHSMQIFCMHGIPGWPTIFARIC